MTPADNRLLQEVLDLLGRPAYRDHPLHAALDRLYRRHLEQASRLERLMNIADGYQLTAQEDLHATRHELDRRVRRERKLSRIADRYQALLSERNQALLEDSHHDALTGLANRRLMTDHLTRLVATGKRQQRPFTLAMLDIDHFKRINDDFGHQAGDQVLVALANGLRQTLRSTDLCCRWGGEEFLVALPDTTLDQAKPLVSRLCEALRTLDITLDGKQLRLTASIGVTEHHPGEEYDETIHRADHLLLAAKREGRDRCHCAD